MPQPASLIFRHGWILFVVVTALNALIGKFRSRKYISENPGLGPGYDKLLRFTLFWQNLPWLLMGLSIETGRVHSVFSYFHPRDGNPFVSAWFCLVFAEWLFGFWWLFFRNGAELIANHPGFFQHQPKSAAMVKLLYCIVILGSILGFTSMWRWGQDVPEPAF